MLRRDDIADILRSTASFTTRDPQLGYGAPDGAAAVQKALGKARGDLLPNRLTPLFSLYSGLAQTHVYTSFPSAAAAFQFAPFERRPGYSR